MSDVLRWRKFWISIWVFGMCIGAYVSLMPSTPRQAVIPHLDKLIHGSSYALLAIFATCIFQEKRSRWKAIIWLIFFGGLIELAQGYLPTGRTMEFADFIANTIGICVGVCFAARNNILLFTERTVLFNLPKQ
jgi:VanZ family protein